MAGLALLEEIEDKLRGDFLAYTRRAYAMLPAMPEPRILDVGCGSGVVTVELATLGGGRVTGVDPDVAALERLRQRAGEFGLAARIATVAGRLGEVELPEESFDLVWAEGSIRLIGFARCLRLSRELLRVGGCLVLHGEFKDLNGKLARLPGAGYDLVGHFALPENAWWDDYYAILDGRLDGLLETCGGELGARRILEAKRAEVEMVRRQPAAFRSFFLVAQRR